MKQKKKKNRAFFYKKKKGKNLILKILICKGKKMVKWKKKREIEGEKSQSVDRGLGQRHRRSRNNCVGPITVKMPLDGTRSPTSIIQLGIKANCDTARGEHRNNSKKRRRRRRRNKKKNAYQNIIIIIINIKPIKINWEINI